MRLHRKHLLQALTLSLLALAGCTGSDMLDAGNTSFTIDVNIANPETRFDRFALLRVTAINVRPNDPDADASLGPLGIGILAKPEDILNINFNSPTDRSPSQLILSSGEYRISRLEMTDLIFFANTKPPLPLTDCSQAQFYVTPPGTAGIIRLSSETLGGVSINVGKNTGQVVIEIDGAALADAYAHSWACSLTTGVATTFNQAAFIAQAPQFIRITQVRE